MKISVVVVDDSGRKFHGEVALKLQGGGGKAAPAGKAVHYATAKDAPPTAPRALKSLWEKGIFKTPQSFNAVEKALSDLEYNFPKPTLMMALGGAPFLTRQGSRGSYRWVQKYRAKA